MTKDDLRLKKFALQIATQLPSNKKDALTVLRFASELVEWAAEGHLKPASAN